MSVDEVIVMWYQRSSSSIATIRKVDGGLLKYKSGALVELGKTKLLSEKYLPQCDFVYHEFHVEKLGIELNHVAHGTAQK